MRCHQQVVGSRFHGIMLNRNPSNPKDAPKNGAGNFGNAPRMRETAEAVAISTNKASKPYTIPPTLNP